MQSSNEWLQGIQYFRAFAIIEVIVLHVTLFVLAEGFTPLTPQKEIITAFAAFTAFAVEHFLFISGVVLYNKYHDGFSVSTFYKKRFRSVVPPYLVWSTFYFFYPYVGAVLLFSVFNHPTATYSALSNIAQVLNGYLTGLAIGIEHLWFVVLILQLYLLYPLLVKFYNRFARQKNPIYALSFLLLVQIAFTSIFTTTGPTPFRVVFLSGIFYFVFGFYVSEHYGTIKQKITKVSFIPISLAVVLSTIYYAVVLYHTFLPGPVPPLYVFLYQVTGPFYCLLLIFFYLRISMGLGEPHRFFTEYMEKIGEDSFGIYLIHYFFVGVFALALSEVGLSYYNLLFYPTLAFLTLIASYWGVQALYHLPFSSIIIGKPRKKAASPKRPKQASFTG